MKKRKDSYNALSCMGKIIGKRARGFEETEGNHQENMNRELMGDDGCGMIKR
jgi:hypothetical protein